MFYFEGYIDNNGIRFDFKEIYSHLKIYNDSIEDLLIYKYGNLIGRLKAGETIEFNCLKVDNLILKSNGANIRLWAW